MAEPILWDSVSRPCSHPETHPAEEYVPCDELSLVTCYFNSSNFQMRRQTFDLFADRIRASGLNLLTVECAFGDDAFSLPPASDVLRVRAPDVMWQKERLINLAVGTLPKSARKIAWLDCDVLFSNPEWAIQTAALLDDFPIVQTFKTAIRLERADTSYRGLGEVWNGFAWVSQVVPDHFPKNFYHHGHTGFGWAARRELLEEHRLYDACISGSGDHVMAHAMRGDLAMDCNRFPMSPKLRKHFGEWARPFHAAVDGRIGSTPGTILHLWHGDTKDRRYSDRHEELVRMDFDPATHLQAGPNGAWQWAGHKRELRKWMGEYFETRNEDG